MLTSGQGRAVTMEQIESEVVVNGSGAAGIMAAIEAQGARVVLLGKGAVGYAL